MYQSTSDTILIVDDTPTNLQILLSYLQGAGFKVLIATDGQQALARAERGQPDLILLDVLMPGLDGFETCRRLKQNPALQDIPVIFLTALSDTPDKLTGFAAGGVDYITKPLEHEEVLARVRTHLTIRKLQRALTEQNQRLQAITAQLQAITEALTRFVQTEHLAEPSALLLHSALQQTQSPLGLLAMLATSSVGGREREQLWLLALAGDLGGRSLGEKIQAAIARDGYSEHAVRELGVTIGQVVRDARALLRNGSEPLSNEPLVAAFGNLLGLPVLAGGEVIGVLLLGNRAQGYSHADQLVLEPLLQAIGVLFERARGKRREALLEQQRQRAEADIRYLKEEIKTYHDFGEVIGQSGALRQVLVQVEQVARTDSTVLILGETGTGKELIARALHDASARKDRPLIKMNCAALPENLVESELFGHERGAFTGATSQRKGRFELADGGTLFLDEIGDMPLAAQSKLLRVLQEGEFERVGGHRTLHVDVRVLAATHQDLPELVAAGRFRQDLYYRLNVFPLNLPPLRERPEDILPLVQYFVARFAAKMGRHIERVSAATVTRLQAYPWPGNVRELENIIERAVILASDSVLDIPPTLLPNVRQPPAGAATAGALTPPAPEAAAFGQLWNDRPTLAEVQRRYILKVLRDTAGVIEGEKGAALILGLHPSTLRNRMLRLGVNKLKSRRR
jgi:DNA-binding NtrC family response regulator